MAVSDVPDLVPIAFARRLIETDKHPLADNVLRNAAKRLSILEQDPQGLAAISIKNIEILKKNWGAFGVLHPRGAKTLKGGAE